MKGEERMLTKEAGDRGRELEGDKKMTRREGMRKREEIQGTVQGQRCKNELIVLLNC